MAEQFPRLAWSNKPLFLLIIGDANHKAGDAFFDLVCRLQKAFNEGNGAGNITGCQDFIPVAKDSISSFEYSQDVVLDRVIHRG